MSSTQMFLTISAFMLFGIVQINMQRKTLESAVIMDGNTVMQTAIGIARSISDEIQQRKFDNANATKILVYKKDLTAIGAGYGEVYPNLNDIDDFNNVTFTSPAAGASSTVLARTPRCLHGTTGYSVNVRVAYVNPTSPSTTTTSYTFAKRVTVTVTNTAANYSLTTSFIAAY